MITNTVMADRKGWNFSADKSFRDGFDQLAQSLDVGFREGRTTRPYKVKGELGSIAVYLLLKLPPEQLSELRRVLRHALFNSEESGLPSLREMERLCSVRVEVASSLKKPDEEAQTPEELETNVAAAVNQGAGGKAVKPPAKQRGRQKLG